MYSQKFHQSWELSSTSVDTFSRERSCIAVFCDIVFEGLYLLSEVKKSRSAGRQSKEAAPEETSQCVFVDFVRVAGVTLRQGSMPNEIGKRTQFSFETKQGCK